ncbi:DUF2971 domain-containing protein [Pseudomonas sp. P5_109]|uniref:DUF2971 domain-containing protein n=1 Tax=Pseudomonas sp. P5_109 TaxID=3043441 RepID=UPI002A365AFB|nr:DUF2971 domain-containing protein [Pseudomonas sp. P5_109]WPN32134.1 DUF2971 domain-containing protein [Pseudomonas sp. P5_109]
MTDAGVTRVYHFCNEEFGLKNLQNSRLKVATIMDLNDPFEMMCYSSPDKEVRRHLVKLKKDIAGTFGMLCFSRSLLSPVQWGHYGDKHKGVCLAFDVPTDRLHVVEYRAGRIEFDVDQYLALPKVDRFELMKKQLRVKHSQWKYEKEVRQVFLLNAAAKEGMYYFKSFSQVGELRQVIVGCNSEVSREKLKKTLGERYETVECFKVRTAFKSYKIVRNRDESLWP